MMNDDKPAAPLF